MKLTNMEELALKVVKESYMEMKTEILILFRDMIQEVIDSREETNGG